jgi:uncharacterized protein (TIGR02186 family)
MKWFAFFLLFLFSNAALADDLVAGLSQDQVEITSNYTGTDMVVFGAIEGTSDTANAQRDVVVVVRGPNADMQVRRKARVAGLWINRDEMTLSGMPAYYFVASTRPLNSIAAKDILQRYAIGLDNLQPEAVSTHRFSKAVPFIKAAIQERENEKLYAELPQGVEFLSYSLFRVRVPMPASVPRGQYTAEVYLFRDGQVMSAQSTPLFVNQIGLERRLHNFAQSSPAAYGFSAVVLAIAMGWLSSLAFRLRL